MIGTLIESVARPQPRAGGSAASVIAHAILIGSAIAATAGEKRAIEPVRPVEVHLVRIVPRDPEPQPTTPRRVVTTVSSAPSLPALRMPDIIPTSIPPIDFSAAATPTDYIERAGREHGTGCSVACEPTGAATEMPFWSGTDAVMQLRDQVVPPRYPERLRSAGIEGRVLVKFVVDTLGRVDSRTIEIMESTHELFTAAVRETLAKLRFNPASNGAQKIAASAIMPFDFRLR